MGTSHFLQSKSFGFGKSLRSSQEGLPPTLLGKYLGCSNQESLGSKKPMSVLSDLLSIDILNVKCMLC